MIWGRAAWFQLQHTNPVPQNIPHWGRQPSLQRGRAHPAPDGCLGPSHPAPPAHPLLFGPQLRPPTTSSTPGCSRGSPTGIFFPLPSADGAGSSMTVTWSGWVKQPPGPGARMLRAQGSWGDGGTRSAPRRCRSGKHPTFQPSPEHPPRWPGWQVHRVGQAVGAQPMGKTPGGTVSSSSAAVARATMAMAVPATSYSCRLLLRTGEGHRRHPNGFPPAFWEVWGPRVACHRTAWAQHTYVFILQQQQATRPAMTSSGSPVGRDEAGGERPPTREQPRSKRLCKEPKTHYSRLFTAYFQGAHPGGGRNVGAASRPPLEASPPAVAQTSHGF